METNRYIDDTRLDDYLRHNINHPSIRNLIDTDLIPENQEYTLQSPWELLFQGFHPNTSNDWNTQNNYNYNGRLRNRIISFIRRNRLILPGEQVISGPYIGPSGTIPGYFPSTKFKKRVKKHVLKTLKKDLKRLNKIKN